ncbi:hypothetical protein ACQY1Q_14440 [Tenacibaculum sp. TC6]|uniref:hypothetical protein n=1 Tax=Tenacibaculum sp. TC6 TaxID=3423223 RepID=UPI003D36B47F
MSDFIDDTYKRVEKIINDNNLNVRSFEERIDVSNNSIGTAIRRKASFKSNVLNKILQSFPEINPTWLLTGKGEMFLANELKNSLKEPNSKYQAIRLSSQIKSNLIDLILEDKEVREALSAQIDRILKE